MKQPQATHMGFLYDWQYDGSAPFRDILAWCDSYIPDHYCYNGFETIFFNDRGAYAWFLLRWR